MKERVASRKVHREPGKVRAGGRNGANMVPELRSRTGVTGP